MGVSTVLYAASIAPLADASLYEKAVAAASPLRREKTDRYRTEADRRRSLGAELLLREACRLAGIDAWPQELALGAHGKPFFPKGELHFNLSHSGDFVLCAVSSYEVGCDVEQIAPANLSVARRFFAPGEFADLCAQTDKAVQTDRFYFYWTLKESVVKALGSGMHFPLRDFAIIPGTPIRVTSSAPLPPCSLFDYPSLPGYRAALCVLGQENAPDLQILDLSQLCFLR